MLTIGASDNEAVALVDKIFLSCYDWSMIKAVFSDSYYSANDSMAKLPEIAKRLVAESIAEIVAPDSLDVKRLERIHAKAYVDAFMSGEGKLATSNGFDWSPQLRDAVLAINAGQLKAAEIALSEGIAANIGQGFHHAMSQEGAAFCTFNGLALVAAEYPDKKIFVLDCDEHQGNGTKEFCKTLENLTNWTIFGSYFDSPYPVRRNTDEFVKDWSEYRISLRKAVRKIYVEKPDLVIYQAGMDCHKGDYMARFGYTAEQLEQRDRWVFNHCKASKIPVMFCMAGGYSEQSVDLHVQTFREANKVYS